MKELIMVKVFVDKVDGDIVFTHYLEENDKDRKYTLVFNVRTGEILEHQKDWKFVHSILDMQNRKFTLHGKKQAKFLKFL